MKVAAEDYAALKAFFVEAIPTLMPIVATMPPEIHPVAVLDRFERNSPAKARAGLGMAIGDMIEQAVDFTPERVNEIDADLGSRKVLTLSEVRARFASDIRRIMQRGKVNSEREYYALRNVADAMPEGESEAAWRLLDAFGGPA